MSSTLAREAHYSRRSFSLSLVVHALLLALVIGVASRGPKTQSPEKIWVELVPSPDKRDLIVQSQEGRKTKLPAPNAFLGAETRVVEEQTVSQRPSEGTTSKNRSKSQPAQPRVPKVGALSHLGVPLFSPSTSREMRPDWANQTEDYNSAAPKDYVQGIKEAYATALNTKEYVYFGYFQRIRVRLDRAWRPLLKAHLQRLYERGRAPARDMDHVTKTLVTLNQKGEVVRVQVLEESGTHDLDDAAVRAFNQAGPFPNPPTGLVDTVGSIQIRWDFILKT